MAQWTSENTNYEGGTRYSTATINGGDAETDVLILNPKAETRFTVEHAGGPLEIELSVAKNGNDGLVKVYRDGAIITIDTPYNDVFAAGITGLRFTGATDTCVIRVTETLKGLV